MYRKPRGREQGGILDLDSLMDILSCLVGVMLFLVIYTVLELGSAAYSAEVVVSPNRHPRSQRVLVLANHGTVRVLDVRPSLGDLLAGVDIVRNVPEVEVFVDASRPVNDPNFRYSLAYAPNSTSDMLGLLALIVEERPGAEGDDLRDLDESGYLAALGALDPDNSWLAFAVDEESGDIFRIARELAIARGFATGFDLLTLEFPLTLPLSSAGLGDLLSPIGQLDKPER